MTGCFIIGSSALTAACRARGAQQPGENGHINAQSAAWACLPRDMKSGVATTRVASPTSNALCLQNSLPSEIHQREFKKATMAA